MKITEQIDKLLSLAKRADLDPLKSHHIIGTGYTHMANLTERIHEGGGKGGRGRRLAMIPKEWADYIAALDNRTPALLHALRALLVERDAQMPYMGATDADYARARSAREQADAAIHEAEE